MHRLAARDWDDADSNTSPIVLVALYSVPRRSRRAPLCCELCDTVRYGVLPDCVTSGRSLLWLRLPAFLPL